MKFTGIRFRLLLLGIGPALFIALILSFYFLQGRVDDLENSLTERGNFTVRQLASASIYGVFSRNRQILNNLVNTLVQEKDIILVRIINNHGEVLAEAIHPPLPANKYILSFSYPVVISPAENDDLSMIERHESDTKNKQIAQVEIKLSKLNTLKKQRTILFDSLFIIVAILTFTALLASRLGLAISRPVTQLTRAVKEISDGKMEARAEFHADSELEELRTGFNTMAIGLQQTQRYLENQIDNATNKLRFTLKSLKEKNLSLDKSRKLAVAQNEIKSQFLAHISHEIRTPMNGIIGFSELLSRSRLSTQQAEQVLLVKESAVHLLTIVNEILDYSSIESGNFKISFKFFNLYSCLEKTVSFLNVQSHKIPIILDIENDVPSIVKNDPIRLQQIITNLLGNAIKFTCHGHIIIRCRVLKKNLLIFSVSDTGPGISEQQQKHLFTPFLQQSEFAFDHETGTGLGLTISKNIVERLQGSIGVISRENTGSTFWFTLPVQIQEKAEIKLNNKNIVLIDHFYPRNKAFQHQLERLGYTVHCYDSAEDFTNRHSSVFDFLFFVPLPVKNQAQDIKAKLGPIKTASSSPLIILNSPDSHIDNDVPFPVLSYPCRSEFLADFLESLQSSKTDYQFIKKPLQAIARKAGSILIIDDNEINRLVLQSQLEPYYRQITLASNGRHALKLLTSTKYNLILLDLQMPELSGIDLIHLIKEKQCINNDTPIIAITAHAQKNQYQAVIDAGFDDCLIKPIFALQLYKCISHLQPEVTELHPGTVQPNDHKGEGTINATKIDRYCQTEANDLNCVVELLTRTQQNRKLAKSLFERLFHELPQQIISIADALKKTDYALAADTTHKLHGSVSFCGLTNIQKAAFLLESSLLNHKSDLIENNFYALQDQVRHFLNAQKTIIDQLADTEI